MLIGTIDFPQEVIDSQRNGKLVVFAGAGVSMPDPSNLDDFARLADRIGAPRGWTSRLMNTSAACTILGKA